MQLHWNGEVSLGNVLTLLGFIAVLYNLHRGNIDRIVAAENRLSNMESKLDKIWRAVKITFPGREED